jgi:hypothetical protein
MYNSQFVCTYSFYDSNLRNSYHGDEKFDLEDVEDLEDLAELIYKTDLLKAMQFTVDEVERSGDNVCFNNEKLLQLYDIVKSDVEFMECIEKSREKHSCEDLESGFVTLFSYDYFFLTHKCICDILNYGKVDDGKVDDGKVKEENINRLKRALGE